MKKLLYYATILIVIIIAISSCKKQSNEPPKKGDVQFLENGISKGHYYTHYIERGQFLEIHFAELFSIKYPRQEFFYQTKELGFFGIPKKIGKYYLKNDNLKTNIDSIKDPASRYRTYQESGEMLCEIYSIKDEDVDYSYIEIIKEKNNFKEVWGRFQLSFIKVDSCQAYNNPKLLKFEMGTFHVKLNK